MEDLVQHHLLEIILWPMPDGTFKEIRNSVERLKELGIYNQYKLTIPMPSGVHTSLHQKGVKDGPRSEETKLRISDGMIGKNKGKHHPISEETRRKIGDANRGKVRSEECKRRNSESHIGKKQSKATCRKRSETMKGMPGNTKGKHYKVIAGKRVYY